MTSDPLAAQRYYEDVSLGDEFEEVQHPTAEHVQAFMAAPSGGRSGQGDRGQGRFSDASEARRQGLERPIVPGTMSSAMLTRLVTDWMGPLGQIRSLDVSFRRPVSHGDRLRCLAVVIEADDEPQHPTSGVIRLDLAFENERGERPVQGTAEVELPRRTPSS